MSEYTFSTTDLHGQTYKFTVNEDEKDHLVLDYPDSSNCAFRFQGESETKLSKVKFETGFNLSLNNDNEIEDQTFYIDDMYKKDDKIHMIVSRYDWGESDFE